MGVVRESIPKPWDDVDLVLIKYMTLEGRYKALIASHLFLLNHFIFPEMDKVNFPFFIFDSMIISVEKVKHERAPLPLHGVVIKLVVDRVMAMVPRKVPKVKVIIDGRVCDSNKRAIDKDLEKGRTYEFEQEEK